MLCYLITFFVLFRQQITTSSKITRMAALPFVTSVVHYSMGSYTKASNVKVSDRSLNLKGQLKLKHIYIYLLSGNLEVSMSWPWIEISLKMISRITLNKMHASKLFYLMLGCVKHCLALEVVKNMLQHLFCSARPTFSLPRNRYLSETKWNILIIIKCR